MTTPEHPPLPPISKHHVLYLSTVVPTLSAHLVKSLFLLAFYADHKTGESRPGMEALVEWDIPYSTWHRHMGQLARLGLVKQTVKGNKKAHLAATYRLLYVDALSSERTTSRATATDPSPHRGGEPNCESRPGRGPALDAAEQLMWAELSAKILAQLDAGERARLEAQLPDFEQIDRLRRTAVRLLDRGGEFEVIEALTRRKDPRRGVYEGATNVLAAMWSRLRHLADAYGIDMADSTPVSAPERRQPLDPTALDGLNELIPGMREVLDGLRDPA